MPLAHMPFVSLSSRKSMKVGGGKEYRKGKIYFYFVVKNTKK
jgi:hypothetical protein